MKILSTVLLALTGVSTANADLMSSTGAVSVISPPPDVRVNIGLESDTLAYFFREQRDFTLGSNVSVNITSPGLVNSTASLTPGTIASGMEIDSYYLHVDPVGSAKPLHTYDGSVTFDTDILGVIVLNSQFANSDGILGHPGTLYSSSAMKLEIGGLDSVTLLATGRTLEFHFGTNTKADDIRILTAASVPEPSAWILLLTCAGLCFAVMRKRRKMLRPQQ